jgi:multidrug efflux pump subunit AcrA (membrane-fusion protein)
MTAFSLLVAVSFASGQDSAELKAPSVRILVHTVKRESFQPRIRERVTLEPAEQDYVTCTARAFASGSPVATTVKCILVRDGDKVKKGQLLIELDEAPLQEQLAARHIAVVRAGADRSVAEVEAKLTVDQNESDINSATATVHSSELDLEQASGELERSANDIKARLLTAEADVEDSKENLEEATTKAKSGAGSDSRVRAARLRLEAAQLTLAKTKQESEAFEKSTRRRVQAYHEGKLAEARLMLKRTQQMATAKLAEKRSEVAAKKSLYDLAVGQFKNLEEQRGRYKIFAPRDGVVGLSVFDGDGAVASRLMVGDHIREGQHLLAVSDQQNLQVVVLVPQSQMPSIQVNSVAHVSVEGPQKTDIIARVSHIASVPSAKIAPSGDRLFPVVIAIENKAGNVRPGPGAIVSLDAGKTRVGVLTMPARAVLGDVASGKKASCLVYTADGPEEREVELGQSDGDRLEILSGLREHDDVIVSPRLAVEILGRRNPMLLPLRSARDATDGK